MFQDAMAEYLDSLPPIEEVAEEYGRNSAEDDVQGTEFPAGSDENGRHTREGDGYEPDSARGDGENRGDSESEEGDSPYAAAWEKAELLDALDRQFADNDVEFVARLIEQMPTDRQAALMESLGSGSSGGRSYDADGASAGDTAGLPAMIDARIDQQVEQIAPYIDVSNIEVQVLRAELEAVRELLGLELPPVDRGSVMRSIRNGNTTYSQAVAHAVGDSYKRAVKEYHQARKARPDTPGGSVEGLGMPGRGMNGMVDAVDIYHQLFGGTR